MTSNLTPAQPDLLGNIRQVMRLEVQKERQRLEAAMMQKGGGV